MLRKPDINFMPCGTGKTTWGALIPTMENGLLSNRFIQRDYWSEVEFIKNSKGEIESMVYDGFKGVKVKDQ